MSRPGVTAAAWGSEACGSRIPLSMRPGAQAAWTDQVPRLQRFKREHPEVTINGGGASFWEGLTRNDAGQPVLVVTRWELKDFLDALEVKLDGEDSPDDG